MALQEKKTTPIYFRKQIQKPSINISKLNPKTTHGIIQYDQVGFILAM